MLTQNMILVDSDYDCTTSSSNAQNDTSPFDVTFNALGIDTTSELSAYDSYTLRPYELDGIEFLRTNHRAMLTYEPGLGKTITASRAAETSATITISCPAYLTDMWFDWITSQYSDDSVVLVSGTRYQRTRALLIPCKWRILNHEMFRTYLDIIPTSETLIIDEMHHFRNRDAKQSKGMLIYSKQCKNVYGLTGTPIVKDPDDYFMQLRILDPYTFTSYNDFVYTYCTFSQSMYGMQITGIKNRTKFKELLSAYVMGMTYEDAGIYLPPINRNFRRIKLSPDNRKLYNDIRDYYASSDPDLTFDNALSVMHALRTITSHAPEKREFTAMLADDLPSNYAILTWYKPAAQYIASKLGIPYISGDIAPNLREQQCKATNRLVATISSVKEGVDLSHITNVIFFEEWYTYGVMHQVLSRFDRFRPDGSQLPVNVYYIHANETIDQGIHAISQKRTQTAHDVRSMIRKELLRG